MIRKQKKTMTTLTNNSNFATIVNKGNNEFVVHFGYYTGQVGGYGNDTCTGRKAYKTEKSAVKAANKYLGLA